MHVGPSVQSPGLIELNESILVLGTNPRKASRENRAISSRFDGNPPTRLKKSSTCLRAEVGRALACTVMWQPPGSRKTRTYAVTDEIKSSPRQLICAVGGKTRQVAAWPLSVIALPSCRTFREDADVDCKVIECNEAALELLVAQAPCEAGR